MDSIASGNPSIKKASFSRFILPFAWNRCAQTETAIDPGKAHFSPAKLQDWLHSASGEGQEIVEQDRWRYFTPETDNLLYKRAGWFVLRGPDWDGDKKLTLKSGLNASDREFTVAMRPPGLVLFEYAGGKGPCIHSTDGLMKTGFIVLEFFFPDSATAPTIRELFRFNEIFRHWRCPYNRHAEFCKSELSSLAKALTGKDGDENSKNFYQNLFNQFLRCPVADGSGAFYLVDIQKMDSTHVDPVWMVQPDDRAFTLGSIFIEEQPLTKSNPSDRAIASLVAEEFITIKDQYSKNLAGLWVSALNVDRPFTKSDFSCTRFEYEWAFPRTYRRWAEFGTLYGFTPHSFVMLAPGPSASDTDPHGEPPLAQHCAKFYFDCSLLLLYVRVTLFRFSKELHDLSARVKDEESSAEFDVWQPEFEKIRWNFMLFENLYQFALLSNQQQHSEMYDLQRKNMEIKDLYEEVSKEIQSSDTVLTSKLDNQRNSLAMALNWVAGIGLAAGIALSWMDVNELKGFPTFILLFIPCLCPIFLLNKGFRRQIQYWAKQQTKC